MTALYGRLQGDDAGEVTRGAHHRVEAQLATWHEAVSLTLDASGRAVVVTWRLDGDDAGSRHERWSGVLDARPQDTTSGGHAEGDQGTQDAPPPPSPGSTAPAPQLAAASGNGNGHRKGSRAALENRARVVRNRGTARHEMRRLAAQLTGLAGDPDKDQVTAQKARRLLRLADGMVAHQALDATRNEGVGVDAEF